MADAAEGPPYTPVVTAGEWLVVSGQIGLRDGVLVQEGFAAELAQALENLRTQLAGHGADLADVVKTTVFLTDLANYAELNRAYGEAFASPRPARSAVEVSALPLGAQVEIEAWAVTPAGGGAFPVVHPGGGEPGKPAGG